ncbi:TPA: hypothetical protein EYN98_01770 [Candidatus Poribacteria bacterium]|nr:hypothetical protein [Candidatus Poribacteria bacterium]
MPTLEVSHRYKQEEAKKKESEARLARQKTVVTEFKVDLEEFRYLMRLELLREETQKAVLHALIEEIVVYSDARVEVKYRSETDIKLQQKRLKVLNPPVFGPSRRSKPR